jgi:hypothetical protein
MLAGVENDTDLYNEKLDPISNNLFASASWPGTADCGVL